MDQLTFSYNWNNKLEGKFYTTIRLASPKYVVGKCFEVYLKGKKIHHAQVAEIRGLKLNDINSFIAGIDTGYSVPACKDIIKKMYRDRDWVTQNLMLVLLQVVTEQDTKQFEPY